jgi:phage shock protein PspC (stress-responsive transcriptional regulator)
VAGVTTANPLNRSRRNRILGGVCGGFASWLGWSPTVVRILYVAVSICSAAFPGILVYVILWLLMPLEE